MRGREKQWCTTMDEYLDGQAVDALLSALMEPFGGTLLIPHPGLRNDPLGARLRVAMVPKVLHAMPQLMECQFGASAIPLSLVQQAAFTVCH